MKTVKLFHDGKSQVAKLPKEFRLAGGRVYIKRAGNAIILLPYENPWESLLDSLSLFSTDFMEKRDQPPMQDRKQ